MADPQKKAAMRPIFKRQMEVLKAHLERIGQAHTLAETVDWYMPDPQGWAQDLFDLEGMHKPFDRKEHDDDFIEVIKNPEESGTTADLALISLQGDWLASLERAFRDRHKTSIRTKMHAACRETGHGNNTGVLALGMRGFIEYLEKASGMERP